MVTLAAGLQPDLLPTVLRYRARNFHVPEVSVSGSDTPVDPLTIVVNVVAPGASSWTSSTKRAGGAADAHVSVTSVADVVVTLSGTFTEPSIPEDACSVH